MFFCFKQKTAEEMRISDWSSDVCSSDQLGDHVRMDLLYGMWSDRTKAGMDVLTVGILIFYLVILLYGGISSTQYALQYNEVSPTLWRPQMAPSKNIMCIGDRKSVV